MDQGASFIFDVYYAGGSREIEDKDDLEEFLEELTAIGFSQPVNETISAAAGDIYVFSTACDTMLPSFLLANAARPVNLFLIQPAEKKVSDSSFTPDIEVLKLGDFLQNGCVISPSLLSRGLLQKKVQHLNVSCSNFENYYAEIKV